MDRRIKAALNRDKGARLNAAWDVGATQARYSDDGHWYAALERFPAALFDANGYVLFSTMAEYESSPHFKIGKQISVPKPGISGIPGYVLVEKPDFSPSIDVDVHTVEASEGSQRLLLHLQRERNRSIVRRKKRSAGSLDCEVCGFSFGKIYGEAAHDYCEIHHLIPLSDVARSTTTRIADLAVLCANCHRVVHLRNPPYTLDEVRSMIGA